MRLRLVCEDEQPEKKSRYRRLRHFERMAHADHRECHQCGEPIVAGSYYEADVVIKEAGGIYVAKYHIDPPCPRDPLDDPSDELDRENEERRTSSKAA